MLNPFDVWAPIFRAPFSGDVTQEIAPRLFSPDIQGVPEIEHRVQVEVASYGKQLGKILEALQTLRDHTKATGPQMDEIDAIVRKVDVIKDESKEAIRADAEAALDRLRKADRDAWRAVVTARSAEATKDADAAG